MLLSPQNAKRFMATYERVAIAVHAVSGEQVPANPRTCLASAREQLQDNPDLLDEAVSFLQQRHRPTDREVVEALRQMRLAEWVHLKDLRTGAIFLNPAGTEAYSTAGLTQQPSAIIGSRGFLVETALCPFAGTILCDGVFIASAQLGQGLWRDFHKRYLYLKAAGRLVRDPSLMPTWKQPNSETAQP